MAITERVEAWAFTIRPMREADVRFAAHEHRTCFPEGFFARLGLRFLRGYYRTFLDSEHACAMVVCDDDRPVGYLAGMTCPTGHRAHVLRTHRTRLAFLGGTALVVRPLLLVEFLRSRARRYWVKVVTPDRRCIPAGTAGNAAADGSTRWDSEAPCGGDIRDPEGAGPAVLVHVAVTSRFRERGIGQALISQFVRQAGLAGCAHVLLVTESGGQAARFYRRRRWASVGERQAVDGRSLTTYSYPTLFPTPTPTPAPALGNGAPSQERVDEATPRSSWATGRAAG